MKGGRHKLDRISALPQDTIEKILTLMPIRDAVRTSILSRKWRFSWTTIPKLVFNDNMIVSSRNIQLNKYKFVTAIFHVLLIHSAPISEFTLFVHRKPFSEIDQIILHLSRSKNIKKFIFKNAGNYQSYLLPCSLFSLKGLEHLDLTYCRFELPLMDKGFGMLKSLRFSEVDITNKMVLRFLANCPVLEQFTWITVHFIEITDCELVELFKCLPSVQILQIPKLYIEVIPNLLFHLMQKKKQKKSGYKSIWLKHSVAGGMPHKLPMLLPHLRILVLNVSSFELPFVLWVMSSFPNLEKIKIEISGDDDEEGSQPTFKNLVDDQDYMGLHLDNLKELEITGFSNYGPEMEFVKLVMAKSPVLKKVRIELCSDVSVYNEVRMLRGLLLLPFPRASPAANFIIKRPK